jgi:hypothetical protein
MPSAFAVLRVITKVSLATNPATAVTQRRRIVIEAYEAPFNSLPRITSSEERHDRSREKSVEEARDK